MNTNKKPLVGIDLGIDPEYLENVIKQTVTAGIAEGLFGKEELAQQLIGYVLNTSVDRNGRVSTYSGDKNHTLLKYLTEKAVKKAAQEALEEAMCDAMLKSLLDNLTNTYKTNISFSFEREKEW